MSDEDQKSYAQIVELSAAIKKKLCSTWRSEQLDKQAISDLKFAISHKKDILDQDGLSVYDKLIKEFENWVYEVELDETSLNDAQAEPSADLNSQTNITSIPLMTSQAASNTQMTL